MLNAIVALHPCLTFLEGALKKKFQKLCHKESNSKANES